MKPRIRRTWINYRLVTGMNWSCEGQGYRAFGRTPAEAYSSWADGFRNVYSADNPYWTPVEHHEPSFFDWLFGPHH